MKRHALTLWLAGTALALSACGGDDPEPEFTAEPSSSPSPTASATPVAEQETPEEFIRRWNEIDRRMQNTGDTSDYLANTKGCDVCEDIAARAESLHNSGGFLRWEGRKITRIEHMGHLVYDVWFEAAPTQFREGRRGEITHLDGGPAKNRYILSRSPSGFKMTHMAQRPL